MTLPKQPSPPLSSNADKQRLYAELQRRHSLLLQYCLNASDRLDAEYRTRLEFLIRYWQPLTVYDYFQLLEVKIAYEAVQEHLNLCMSILLGNFSDSLCSGL